MNFSLYVKKHVFLILFSHKILFNSFISFTNYNFYINNILNSLSFLSIFLYAILYFYLIRKTKNSIPKKKSHTHTQKLIHNFHL